MNFTTPEFLINRQRCQQWVPLITQQYRLRHVYQIMCLNLLPDVQGRFYYTLHLTTMCAPFYTSCQCSNPHPKWPELDLRGTENTSASCIVLRIWQANCDGADKIVLTWGVNFSGLVFVGNKIADIQPYYFKQNTVIFYMLGGYFTSHHLIRTDLQKPIPFRNGVNTIDTLTDTVIYKRVSVKVNKNEVQNSYNIEKLRKLQSLQLQIRNKGVDVQNVRDRINTTFGNNSRVNVSSTESTMTSPTSTVRYAPQLLTMNSLNKLLQERPTGVQRQEMQRISKEIEVAKFRARLLSQEKDRKTIVIRHLKQQHMQLMEENEEKNSDLMENYRKLSRSGEKLKEYKRSISQHRELYSDVILQLQQRRRQLLHELLFIYPIEKISDNRYAIYGIHLPNSDVLADSADVGISVALGYVTHILIMCSTFLQVPLRYMLTHYGSRSYITDTISPLLPEKERDFPLFTRGKDKAQFTYAVYLLNKNIAQLRWLHFMNTNDLRATLHNLLMFLQGHRESRFDVLSVSECSPTPRKQEGKKGSNLSNEKCVSLQSIGAISNISDPVLDCIRQEKQVQRRCSPTRKAGLSNATVRGGRNSECGKGLTEALALPEAYLNRQISSDALRNYMIANEGKSNSVTDSTSSGDSVKTIPVSTMSSIKSNFIKITQGKASKRNSFNDKDGKGRIEKGQDPLNPESSFTSITIKTNSDSQLCRETLDDNDVREISRISRSVDTYIAGATTKQIKSGLELGYNPQRSDDSVHNSTSQREFLEKWLESTPTLTVENSSGGSPGISRDSPLTARTDALLSTKSFNLVKPK